MRLVAQGIEDQDIQPLQQTPAVVGDLADVGAISDVVDPKSEDS